MPQPTLVDILQEQFLIYFPNDLTTARSTTPLDYNKPSLESTHQYLIWYSIIY